MTITRSPSASDMFSPLRLILNACLTTRPLPGKVPLVPVHRLLLTALATDREDADAGNRRHEQTSSSLGGSSQKPKALDLCDQVTGFSFGFSFYLFLTFIEV